MAPLGADSFTSLADFVRHAPSHRSPDRVAVVEAENVTTWDELRIASDRVAQGIATDARETGSRVAFLGRGCAAYFEVLFGAAKAGAVPVPLNWRLSVRELAAIIDDAQPDIVVVESSMRETMERTASLISGVPRILVCSDPRDGVFSSYEKWKSCQPAVDPGFALGPQDTALQIYTSGTTAKPKGVLLPNRAIEAVLDPNADNWGYTQNSVNLAAPPLFHAGGAVWALLSMWRGARTLLANDLSPESLVHTIHDAHVTHTALVPTLIQAIADFLLHPRQEHFDVSSLELVAYGSAPVSPQLLQDARSTLDCRFSQMYGLTETAGGVFELRPDDHDVTPLSSGRLASCGRPLPWVEKRIVDPDTEMDVPLGAVGELWLRSEQNMSGYWRDPKATAERLTIDNWFRSGDLGFEDAEGYVYLKGRRHDRIISGGENVYPTEVELVLQQHPAVHQAAVTGIPDTRWGERVVAAVVTAPGFGTDTAALLQFVQSNLARYKMPRNIVVLDELPRNAMGKVSRAALRDIIIAEIADDQPAQTVSPTLSKKL